MVSRSTLGVPQTPRVGDRPTEAGLDLLRILGWLVLHDVATADAPNVRIDHLLVGPSGVYVINSVTWTGTLPIVNGVVTSAASAGAEAMAEVSSAASAVRRLVGDTPVAPLLCLVRHESVVGFVYDVALCSTENILDVVTGLPPALSEREIREVSRRVSDGVSRFSPHPAPRVESVEAAPNRHSAPARPARAADRPEIDTLMASYRRPSVVEPPAAPKVELHSVVEQLPSVVPVRISLPDVPAPKAEEKTPRVRLTRHRRPRSRWETVWITPQPTEAGPTIGVHAGTPRTAPEGGLRRALAWRPTLTRRGYGLAFLTAASLNLVVLTVEGAPILPWN